MIPITRPYVGQEEAAAAASAVLSGWLSQGNRVLEFENAVAEYVGARYAVATSNCTTALHIALLAAGVRAGSEVICPSFTFIATANAIVHAGARPVFVDIDPLTYNIDPDLIEAAITTKTSAIMPVDQIGLPADIPAILEIARRYNLPVIEDAAPSLGSTVGEQRVGSLSNFTCFSFHPRKSITTGEGGIVTTDDENAAQFMRTIRSHGASTSDLARHNSGTTEIEEYCNLGYNYRMTDIQGAIGTVQMRKLDEVLRLRQRVAQRYREALQGLDTIRLPFEPESMSHTYQSFCIRLYGDKPRAVIMSELAALGIATRRGVMAAHLEPFYRSMYQDLVLPETEDASHQTLLLPLYADMSEADQDFVIESLIGSLS